jgi:hypothetical protein
LSAGFAHNLGYAIHLLARLCPKRDPRLVWTVTGVFRKPKKFRRFTSAIFFKGAPFFRALIESESNCRQDFGEKLLRSRPVSDAQIDMIKEATLQSSGQVNDAKMPPRVTPLAAVSAERLTGNKTFFPYASFTAISQVWKLE